MGVLRSDLMSALLESLDLSAQFFDFFFALSDLNLGQPFLKLPDLRSRSSSSGSSIARSRKEGGPFDDGEVDDAGAGGDGERFAIESF